MSRLQLVNLTKTFPDGTQAVKGIDLAVEDGEFIVLLGPSGCGKTTTLRMIAGLEPPSGGRVIIGGRDVTSLRPARRNVGLVFQFYALYPHMTVRGNIAFPLEAAGQPRRQRSRIVDAVAARMGLEDLLDRYPKHLSGGDRQRVALARAMVRCPSVYLMDEPLGTLDADQRLRMREFIRAQQLETKVTTVYVTHDQAEAMSLADRVVVMAGGRLCQVGPPSEVYDRPASLFVADFIGSPGMNFIPGRIERGNGGERFVPDGSRQGLPLPRPLPTGRATLGVRPEHIRRDADGPIRGKVTLDEYQGAFRTIHVDAGLPCNLIVRADAAEAGSLGKPVRLSFDPEHTRLFDAESGRSL